MDKYEALKTYFGYDSFRPGQENIVDTLIQGKDTLCVMPTGAGKSLCYQVPALVKEGITLVISPLISLMKDQVTALNNMGIRAAFLNSSLTASQQQEAIRRAAQGAYKLIYVAPERLEVPSFLDFVYGADIALIAVDEAHCVSQWGQDFRPSYLKIGEFLDALPHRPPVGAFTATATPRVKEDIERLLRLRDPFRLQTGFDRENLCFLVQKPDDKFSALLRVLSEHEGESVIVYCNARKTVDQLYEKLRSLNMSVAKYHAGMEDSARRIAQEEFQYGQGIVMVATNAFGMGIDKPDVRAVVHYNMPKDIESYYQEAGRAGRDGLEAQCILLYGKQDVIAAEWMINHSEENAELTPQERGTALMLAHERLKQMTFYATNKRCLRAFMLRYFGESNLPKSCGNCSVCLGVPFETKEEKVASPKSAPKKQEKTLGLSEEDSALYKTLSSLRLKIASEQRVPAYMVFDDKTLTEMARKKPQTREEFLDVKGVGRRKLEQYGSQFLSAIRSNLPEGETLSHWEQEDALQRAFGDFRDAARDAGITTKEGLLDWVNQYMGDNDIVKF